MDEDFLWHAIKLACEAEAAGEVPVGAVVVLDGNIIGCGRNSPMRLLGSIGRRVRARFGKQHRHRCGKPLGITLMCFIAVALGI